MEPLPEDAEIGEIKFQPRLGIQRDNIALGDAERVESGRDFTRRGPYSFQV